MGSRRRGDSAATPRRCLHRDHLSGEFLEIGRRRGEDDHEVRLLPGPKRPVLGRFEGLEKRDLTQRELLNVARGRPAEDDLALLPRADDAPLDLDRPRGDRRVVDCRPDDDEDELIALHSLILAVHVRELDARGVESCLDHPRAEHGEGCEELPGRVGMRVDVDGENRVADDDREERAEGEASGGPGAHRRFVSYSWVVLGRGTIRRPAGGAVRPRGPFRNHLVGALGLHLGLPRVEDESFVVVQREVGIGAHVRLLDPDAEHVPATCTAEGRGRPRRDPSGTAIERGAPRATDRHRAVRSPCSIHAGTDTPSR